MKKFQELLTKDLGWKLLSILPRSACMDELKKGKIAVLPIENLSMIREMNILYHHTFKHVDILQDIVKIYNDFVRFYKN